MKEKEFVKGLYFKKRHEKAPQFIIMRGSIKLSDMIMFCQSKAQQGEEYVNFDIKMPMDESKEPYAQVNNWKPEKKEDNQLNEIPF